jgi:uncharacterized protein (TIGR03435 family)
MVVPTTFIANAQKAPIQQFEVASVKPKVIPRGLYYFPSPRRSDIIISGTRISTSGALFHLVAAAYGLQFYQVASGPDWSERWTSTEAFDIEARAPGDAVPTHDQVRAMLQALLADRFQLKIHREPKEMRVYNLVAGSGGPKIKPNTVSDPPKMESERLSGLQLRIRYTNFSIAEFIANIMSFFDRPLLDKTGLTGGFDFTLEFIAQPAGMTATDAVALGVPDPDPGLPIVASIQGQLGLRVVPARGPVAILVIDPAEKPSAN